MILSTVNVAEVLKFCQVLTAPEYSENFLLLLLAFPFDSFGWGINAVNLKCVLSTSLNAVADFASTVISIVNTSLRAKVIGVEVVLFIIDDACWLFPSVSPWLNL